MSICVINKTGKPQTLLNGIVIPDGKKFCLYVVNGQQIWSEFEPANGSLVEPLSLNPSQTLLQQIAPSYNGSSSASTFSFKSEADNFASDVLNSASSNLNIVIVNSTASNGGDKEDPNKNVGEILEPGPSYP
jgi:hypothetical protein